MPVGAPVAVVVLVWSKTSVLQFQNSRMNFTVLVLVVVLVLVFVDVVLAVVVETGLPVFVRYLIPVDGQEPAFGASKQHRTS